DDNEALYNWGTALYSWAQTKTGAEADELFKLAGEKYEAALTIKADKHEALYNWGTALSAWAQTKTGAEADELFKLAGEKYEAALQIKADKHEALNNWGVALSVWAQKKIRDEQQSLYQQAKEVLLRAEAIKEGCASYNLACVCALINAEEDCQQWLAKSKEFGNLPSRQHLEQDTDLDSVRKKKWFIEFLETI
ncbi:MAG: hypothetical protein HYZ22_17265, partial [Chloroflexi bacterium]|nr:hypothetical protein [Chloroflexota bacterium]